MVINIKKNKSEVQGLTEIPMRQLGIISHVFTASGNGDNAQLKVDYEQTEGRETYTSGSIKNNGSTTVIVRLASILFDSGYSNISINSGDIVNFKNIRLDIISIPAVVGQATTVNVSFVGITYNFISAEPEIKWEN